MQPSRTCHSRWSMACTEVTDETSLRVTCASVVDFRSPRDIGCVHWSSPATVILPKCGQVLPRSCSRMSFVDFSLESWYSVCHFNTGLAVDINSSPSAQRKTTGRCKVKLFQVKLKNVHCARSLICPSIPGSMKTHMRISLLIVCECPAAVCLCFVHFLQALEPPRLFLPLNDTICWSFEISVCTKLKYSWLNLEVKSSWDFGIHELA